MQKLVKGVHKFKEEVFSKEKEFFEKLANGQSPRALFITCSDSRINPNQFTQTKPGELFILRTAGNIIPPYSSVISGEAATIEYAISFLKVSNIIVCGHSHCGAMSGLLDLDSIKELSAVRSYLTYAEATRRIVEENYSHCTDPEKRLMLTVEENVLVQLESLRTHPSVAVALNASKLKLHGWVYKIETGEVFAYNPIENAFLPIEAINPVMVDKNFVGPQI